MRSFDQPKTAVLIATLLLAGCNTSDPTAAVLDNQYPAPTDADATSQTIVYKAWWSVVLFPDPVPAGQQSDSVRVVPGTDYAYALLAPGWDPSSGAAPATLIPVRTMERLSIERGGTLRVAISDATTLGSCAAGHPLSADDAQFIVERIFPEDFAGLSYDSATCSSAPVTDGGSDGGVTVSEDANSFPEADKSDTGAVEADAAREADAPIQADATFATDGSASD